MIRIDGVDEPWWNDRPVFLIGGGPSLAGRNLSRLRERGTVVGVNRCAFDVPSDAAYSLDVVFMRNYAEQLRRFPGEVHLTVPLDYPPEDQLPNARYTERVPGETGLSDDPKRIANGLNSGYGALNLATLKRAREIYLLGYDLNNVSPGEAHWHGGYAWNKGESIKYYGRWAVRFEAAAKKLPAGVKVWNANPRSALCCFPFTSYEELGV